MKYSAYPVYKESGVQWLGDVPGHWTLKAIKWETSVQRGASPRPIDDPNYFDDEGRYAWVRISDVTTAGMYLESTEQRLSDIGSSLSVKMQPGALFLSIAGTVGKPCITKINCCIHDGFVYFPRWKGDSRYLFYIFASGEPYKGLGKMGTQLNLNTDTVGSIVIGLPHPQEQTAIADFLDRETGRIDTLVAKKRRLVALLKEQRTALISRTVTRGLPEAVAREFGLEPHTRFKDSGIEWLGEVPHGWNTVPAKHLCKAIVDCKNRTPDYFDDGEYYVVRTTDVKNGTINFSSMLRTDLENYQVWTQRGAPKNGDVLFTREAPAGEAAIFNGDRSICLGQRMMYFRPNQTRLLSSFLLYWIYSDVSRGYINSVSGGSTVTHLRVGQVLNFLVIEIPLPEQTAIIAYLDRETAKIDQLVEKVEAAIARLQEYRTALITAAVTGKIDVREAPV